MHILLNYRVFLLLIGVYQIFATVSLNVTDHPFNETFINVTDDVWTSTETQTTESLPETTTVLKIAQTTERFTPTIEQTTTSLNIERSAEMNSTNQAISYVTTQITAEETTIFSNDSCVLTKFGCCSDGTTKRLGPDNQGCLQDLTTAFTVTNSTQIEVIKHDRTTQLESLTDANLTTEEETSTITYDRLTTSIKNISETIELNISSTLQISLSTDSSTSVTTTTTTTNDATETMTTTVLSHQSCVDSQYECCPDGIKTAQGFNFEGCDDVLSSANSKKNSSLRSVCELEKDAGSCSKYVNMWVYDQQQGKCVRFWYGSCEGNANRFESEQICQETCISPRGIEICLLPKITGPCHTTVTRYYYDREKKECQPFPYGGCNGNANNYETLEQCQTMCSKSFIEQCTQTVETGSCRGNFTRFYYDIITGQCRSFVYSGCQKNLNNFVNVQDCMNTCVAPRQKDICLQPKIVGNCQERRASWYFDVKDQECKSFTYSGCNGNNNRFSTKEECELSCSSLITPKSSMENRKSICELPIARGNCDQQMSRWYYNSTDKYCHAFEYSGCHGNANAFENEQDCRYLCDAKERDVCTLEKDSGSCDQYNIMWYFDYASQQCKNFYYGSCGGNANRFATEQECQRRCLIKPGNSSCSQMVDAGYACDGDNTTILKFFYDQSLRKCSSFLYQGCGGNNNRFDEEQQCIDTCTSDHPKVSGCGTTMIRCNVQCRFGYERDGNGCEICRCFEPCQAQACPSGYSCTIIPEKNSCVHAPCPMPRVECQPIIRDQEMHGPVGVKPMIENSITNIFSQFDANITIPCYLRQGYPTPSVYWYKERQQLQVHDAMSNGMIVRKIERLPDHSLLIRKVSLEDQGLYTCRAINDFGQDIKDVQLEVFDPIKVEIYPINRIYQLGFTAKLQCRATGYPSPRTIWMRDHVPLVNSSRITLQNDGSLVIHPYKREDAGAYICNATNKKESVTQVAYLEVKEIHLEPTCEDQPSFANCELVLRHNFCDVYFDYCCHTCSQHAAHSSVVSTKVSSRSRRHYVLH